MNYFIALVLFLVPVSLYAADVPSDVLGSETFDYGACLDKQANDCINNNCLTSDDRDCIPKCKEGAKDVCDNMQQ